MEKPNEQSSNSQATVKQTDMVNHPPHYTSDPSGIECIEITRHRNFNIGNAIKYLWRAGLKDGNSDIQDLNKAIWYIQDEIKRLGTRSDIKYKSHHDNIVNATHNDHANDQLHEI